MNIKVQSRMSFGQAGCLGMGLVGALVWGSFGYAAPGKTLPGRFQLNVNFQGAVVNVLELVAEDERVGALGELSLASCYRGDAFDIISRLNGVFRMFERSEQLRKAELPIRYIRASSRRLDEKPGTIGIQFEDRRDDYRSKRFTIQPCSGPGLEPNSEPAPFLGGVFVTSGINLFSLIAEDVRLPVLGELLSERSCYRGDLLQAVQRLNGVFNMAEGSSQLLKTPIGKLFLQATTPRLDEPRSALGVEYETQVGQSKKRFLIQSCK